MMFVNLWSTVLYHIHSPHTSQISALHSTGLILQRSEWLRDVQTKGRSQVGGALKLQSARQYPTAHEDFWNSWTPPPAQRRELLLLPPSPLAVVPWRRPQGPALQNGSTSSRKCKSANAYCISSYRFPQRFSLFISVWPQTPICF